MSIDIKYAYYATRIFQEIKDYMEKLAMELHIPYDVISIAHFDIIRGNTLFIMCDFLRTVRMYDDGDDYDVIDQKTFEIKFEDGILQSVESYLEDCHKNEYIRACKDKIFFANKNLERLYLRLEESKNSTQEISTHIVTVQNTINDLETKLKKLNEI